MRKLMFLAALFVAAVMNAQTARHSERVRPIEFEIRVGASAPLDGIPHGQKSDAPIIGLELRYNFKNSPIDIGFVIDNTSAFYEYKRPGYETLERDNRTTLIGLTADYNFRLGRTVNPFVGIGLGYGVHDWYIDTMDNGGYDSGSAAVAPRVGVELWRHLRFTIAANLSRKHYNNVSFAIGCVFGGGKKK